ncbi:GtrA family protein [Arenimonas sp. MALMAid1274]|uniref:GtrA family protein n=1 Tax=Arenimonas sp. MALMAid1274 TaxID=3411630 RepID=UPI003B9DE9FE
MIRQVLGFGAVGGLQLLLDWGCFVALTALGLAVVPANLAGRVAGASLGYWLNGRYTFADAGQARLGRRRALRFIAFWIATTALSTWAMQFIDAQRGLTLAWLAKPVVDGLLAALGFVVSKYWIYR